MAAPASSGNDIYLALLAGRAVTGLAKLARNPKMWDEKIESDLGDGLVFCKELKASTESGPGMVSAPEFASVLKRLTAQFLPTQPLVSPEEISSVSTLLRRLMVQRCADNNEELSSAISFFAKASSGHTVKAQEEGSLF